VQKQEKLLQERIGKGGAHYAFVYPNFMINRYGNVMDTNRYVLHACFPDCAGLRCWTGLRAIPISVDETLVQFDYFMLSEEGNGGAGSGKETTEGTTVCRRARGGALSED
jgi:hypothetical protein